MSPAAKPVPLNPVVELIIALLALLALGATIGGFYFGFKLTMKRTDNTTIAVLVAFASAFGGLVLVAAISFGACVCAITGGNMH